MDIIRAIADRKIETAMDAGLFADLPSRGQIDCSLQGERFVAWWFRTHYGHDAAMERDDERKREDVKKRDDVEEHPEASTGGTGTLPEGGVPNPGFTARGD